MFGKKLGLIFASALVLAACGNNSFSGIADKNSDAAQKEDAQIAINKGDYSTAIGIMDTKCPNKTCSNKADAQQYASAYMGKAGLDVLTVAKNADSSKNSNTSGSDFAVLSKGIPNPTAANLDDIASAILILNNSKATVGLKPAAGVKAATVTYNTEQKDILLQLGISQATATILAIGSRLGGFDPLTGIPVNCNGDCSTAASQTAITTALTAVYIAPSTTYADYAATSLVDGSKNLLKAFSGDNSTAGAINNLAASIQHHTHAVKATCSWKVVSSLSGASYEVLDSASAPYTPGFTGTQLISYLQTCLQ